MDLTATGSGGAEEASIQMPETAVLFQNELRPSETDGASSARLSRGSPSTRTVREALKARYADQMHAGTSAFSF
jgi:hypothetical protein